METAINQSQNDKAVIVSQPEPPSLKLHICRVCGKGFASGCALGGHMHIHGIQKDLDMEEEDDTFTMTDSADELGLYSSDPGTELPKVVYSLRTKGDSYVNNHAMLDSWNPILTTHDHDITNQSSSDIINDDAWCKSKPSCTDQSHFGPEDTLIEEEEEEVAQSLIMLSRGEGLAYPKPWLQTQLRKMERSSRSLCWGDQAKQARLQLPLMVPPIRFRSMEQMGANAPVKDAKPVSGYRKLFECKSCNKVFTSHQALGGHRASHRKVKGCSSAIAAEDSNIDLVYRIGATDDANETDNSKAIILSELTAEPGIKKKTKNHECTICHRLFRSGQALGGHKRCHWPVKNSNQPADQQLVDHLGHPVTVAPVFSGSTEPLNLFLDKPMEELKHQPTSLIHYSVPDLGLVTACPRNNVVIDDEADSKNVIKRKRKPGDDRLADLGPDDWLRVGIGSNLPA